MRCCARPASPCAGLHHLRPLLRLARQALPEAFRQLRADPAAEHFKYDSSVDVRNLITLEDVMEELDLGPNGCASASSERAQAEQGSSSGSPGEWIYRERWGAGLLVRSALQGAS